MDQAPQQYDISSPSRGSGVLRVLEVDTTQNPLQVLKIVVESLAQHSDVGLWLSPYTGISMVPRLSPFDLVYLDEHKGVIDVAVLLAGMDPTPRRNGIASALVLPLHSISTLRLDEGVLLNFHPVGEAVEDVEELSQQDLQKLAPESPEISEVADEALTGADSGRPSRSAEEEQAAKAVRKRSRRRPLTEDERRVVETLKGYLVDPLVDLESADRALPELPVTEAPEEVVSPVSAESASPALPEPVASEPAETLLPAPAEAYAPVVEESASPAVPEHVVFEPDETLSSAPDEQQASYFPESDEKPEEEGRTLRRRIRMRRPKAPLPERTRPVLARQETTADAGKKQPAKEKAVPAPKSATSVPAPTIQSHPGNVFDQFAIHLADKEAAEPKGTKHPAEQAPASAKPDEAKLPAGEQKAELTIRLADAARPLDGRETGEPALPGSRTEARQETEEQLPIAEPVKPTARKKPEAPATRPPDHEAPVRRLPIQVPVEQRLSIQPFHTQKKPEAQPEVESNVLKRLARHLHPENWRFANRRGAMRKPVPGLIAYPWGRRDSPSYEIGNLSSSGLYLITQERWPLGAVVSLTLQQKGNERELQPEHRVLVEAGTIRVSDDGLGLVFVLPAAEDIRLWEGLPDSPWFWTGPDTVIREFRTARALTFLRQICPSGTDDFRFLFHKELTFHRVSNAVEIVAMAEEIVARDPGTFKFRAHPKLVQSILDLGSWADSEAVKEYWSGLLATGCTAQGQEVLNLTFAEKISQFTAAHAQILKAVCAHTIQTYQARGEQNPLETYSTAREFMESTRSRNLVKIHQTIMQLCEQGLLVMKSDPSWAGEMPQMRTTPTMLGLELFTRCARSDSRRQIRR